MACPVWLRGGEHLERAERGFDPRGVVKRSRSSCTPKAQENPEQAWVLETMPGEGRSPELDLSRPWNLCSCDGED